MPKKTNLQVVDEGRTHRTGPVKEKEQITIRVDTQLMTEVKALIQEVGVRITDLVERGLILVLHEYRHRLPAWDRAVRHVLANATAKETRLIRGLAIRIKENEIARRSPEGERIWEQMEWFLEQANVLPHAKACLELYAKGGE